MDLTILGVLALTVIVAASVLAPKVGVAAPLVLVGAGVLLALVPGVPRIEPEPELILAGVLPPLLYAASVNMPAMDFRRDLKSIGWLSIVVVISSALAIGWVVEAFVPGLRFAEGVALGAIVSPTDAVATSIVKRTGVAPRLVTVLEGESMINDASALVLLRSAVAATGISVSVLDVSVDFVVAIVVAAVIGLVVGAASVAVRARLHDATINTAISFAVPFIAYAPAEHLGASGLVAVVTTGLVTGYWGPSVLRAQDRLAEAVNWRTIAFLLESGVFLLMGLELGPLLDDFRSEDGDFDVSRCSAPCASASCSRCGVCTSWRCCGACCGTVRSCTGGSRGSTGCATTWRPTSPTSCPTAVCSASTSWSRGARPTCGSTRTSGSTVVPA